METGGDRFAYDCAHHQAFQELSGFDQLKISRGLHHRLQFCSRFELQHRRFSKLNVATKVVRVENGLDVLQ